MTPETPEPWKALETLCETEHLSQGTYGWAVATMREINRLTPDVTDRPFSPDWFQLRQRFEHAESAIRAVPELLRALKGISEEHERLKGENARLADARDGAMSLVSAATREGVLAVAMQEAETAKAELAALKGKWDWQTIETAPKDGSPFLAYGPNLVDEDFNPTGIVEACFDGDQFVGAVWDGHQDLWRTEAIEFTRWMMFPAAHAPREEAK